MNEAVPAKAGVGLDGQAFKFHYTLAVDASGKMPDGQEFQDVRQLKEILLEDETPIARNLIKQMMTFATGAAIGFSDAYKVSCFAISSLFVGATITDGYHNLSHHGKAEDKLAQLKVIDEWQMRTLAGLMNELKAVEEEGESLLDRTMVFYGSNLGDANAHSTNNMPILLAGGGFRHGQHLKFDTSNNYPLPNLFVSMLQRMDIESDLFATSTGSCIRTNRPESGTGVAAIGTPL